MTGEYIMNTDRLRSFLGAEYENVMRYTIADAFADSFKTSTEVHRRARRPSKPRADGTSTFTFSFSLPSTI